MFLGTTGLAVGHRGRAVLAVGDLTVAPGAGIRVTGDNGSGKSTLLATLAGALAPVAGQCHHHAPWAWVPQVGGLSPDLPTTLGEVVDLAGGATAAALARVGLAQRGHQSWAASSGGERQRALLARAFAGGPRLVLLDEPDSHLDRAGRDLLAALLDEHRAAGGSWIAVLHGDLAATGDAWWRCAAGGVDHGPS